MNLAEQHAAHRARRARMGSPIKIDPVVLLPDPVAANGILNLASVKTSRKFRIIGAAVPTHTFRVADPDQLAASLERFKACEPSLCVPVPPVKLVEAVVSDHFAVSLGELRQGSRRASVAFARQVTAKIVADFGKMSAKEIGRRLGRDHSTILYAFKVVALRLETDPAFAAQFETIRLKVSRASAIRAGIFSDLRQEGESEH